MNIYLNVFCSERRIRKEKEIKEFGIENDKSDNVDKEDQRTLMFGFISCVKRFYPFHPRISFIEKAITYSLVFQGKSFSSIG